MKKLSVIGAGQMGTEIAQVAAQIAKIPQIFLFDQSQQQITRQIDKMRKSLERAKQKGTISEADLERTFAAIIPTTSMVDLEGSEFIIEAVTEDLNVKLGVIKSLTPLLASSPHSILASNTSSISITKLAASHSCPQNFIGMHFMNPVPKMKLVEIIKGCQTSNETLQATQSLVERMGKVFTCSEDVPGFIANRILMPYINEAIFVLYEGIADRENIDKTMLLGTNVPMGPLALADFIGLDTCLAIMKVLHTELGDSKYRPCPLLVKYVNAGWLGHKSGRGFYTYK